MAKESTKLSAALRDAVKAIAKVQGGSLRKWGNAESAVCSSLLAMEIAETAGFAPDDRKAVRAAMEAAFREHGVGCNSSQFRQALEGLPEADALRLPKSTAITSDYAAL